MVLRVHPAALLLQVEHRVLVGPVRAPLRLRVRVDLGRAQQVLEPRRVDRLPVPQLLVAVLVAVLVVVEASR